VTKEIILLATSKKYGKYCVAGIDTANGKWLRLVTNDSDAHYAIDTKELILDDGAMAQKLDIVQMELIDKAITYFQTENYIIRSKTTWRKKGIASIDDVIKLHPPNQTEYIFYDTNRRIPRDFYSTLCFNQVHSLLLIQTDKAVVQIIDGELQKRIQIQLTYKHRQYEPLPVTDFEFIDLCKNLQAGSYPMHKKGLCYVA
jgi:hypothetical protein